MTGSLIVQRDVVMVTTDGVELRADVYRPDTPAPVPCVLTRTPYDKSRQLTVLAGLDPWRAAEAGLAVVCQDVRGRHGSGGVFEPFAHEVADGVQAVRWVAEQPWCNGRVGMAGRSYAGATQWLAAIGGAPGLRAICPTVTASELYEGSSYQGGAFQLGANLFWAHILTRRQGRRLTADYEHLPLSTMDAFRDTSAGFYYDWLAHPSRDEYWTRHAVNGGYASAEVAALNIGGWFDPFLHGTLENYREASRLRPGQRLILGPWGHGGVWGGYPDHRLPDMPGADLDLTGVALEFLAGQLGDGVPHREQLGLSEDEPVLLYVMGAGRWRRESTWPPARAVPTPWYLRADGGLSPEPPGDEPTDSFRYDPADPAPTVGGPVMIPGMVLGSSFGPLDNRSVEARPDVLTYTSAPLSAPVEVTGQLSAVLFAATTAADTDFVVKLSDVRPDGASRLLAEGIVRARYRHGTHRPLPVRPGAIERYRVDLVATSTVFQAGHRIRVTVTSSSFPRFDRNLNTGGPIGAEDLRQARVATQTVWHSAVRPSHVLLPVVS
ncbi:CocE/NonD family hydrolase [Solihabitans fulvus]|uniref:CocE/NonD family hydrolase n=1 Tax=Solihabitans fulvus TaxID=1892852 RepID=A0A5B2XI71_9PSEU|nr:CocE/NonD family hydrolase [Solihabitans fulvus]KAA2262689.1 CocE/NonD family hydrolase [Solihabitans fulvus]